MFLPHSDKEVNEILQSLGLSSLEDLFSHIDPSLLEPPKNLPEPKSGACKSQQTPRILCGWWCLRPNNSLSYMADFKQGRVFDRLYAIPSGGISGNPSGTI